MSQLGGLSRHFSINFGQKRRQLQQQQQQQQQQQHSGSGILHNPSLLQAAKLRLCKEMPNKQLEQQQQQQQLQQQLHHSQLQSQSLSQQRRGRFRSVEVSLLPNSFSQQQQQQQQPARRGIDDLCDSVCSTLSDCSILRSSRFPGGGGSIGCSDNNAAGASGDLATALKRLRAARSASSGLPASEVSPGAGSCGGFDAELHAILQRSLCSSSLTALVRASVESLSLSRSYSRHELVIILRRLGQAYLTEKLLPQLLERLESALLQRMLATGLLQLDGDAFFRCNGRQKRQPGVAPFDAETSKSPAPMPRIRSAAYGAVNTEGHCSAGRPYHQLQQNRVSSRYFVNSPAQPLHQQPQPLHRQGGIRLNSSIAMSRSHQLSGQGQASLNQPSASLLSSQETPRKDKYQAARTARPPLHPAAPAAAAAAAAASGPEASSSVTAKARGCASKPAQQLIDGCAIISPMTQATTQQFVVRDNLQLREALVDPEDRRINSIGQRHGCLITVQDRTRRLGHNAHRVIVCAPSDKALRMCARALDKAMGWDLNSQLAYARCKTRTSSAAATMAGGDTLG